ncbi:unnamed protein product, partial [Didymodactylos carnosus]
MHGQINSIQPITLGISPPFDSSKIQDQQRQDQTIKHIHDQLINGKRRLPYTLENGIVHRIMPRYGHTPLKLPSIPQSMIAQLLQAYHDSPTSGHLGVNKTWHKIRDRYYWPGMYSQIKQYILSCSKYQQFKISRSRPAGKLQPIEPPTGMMDLMGLDFIGPVPQSSNS